MLIGIGGCTGLGQWLFGLSPDGLGLVVQQVKLAMLLSPITYFFGSTEAERERLAAKREAEQQQLPPP